MLEGADAKTLRETLDKLKDKLQSAAIVLGAVADGKVSLIAGVTIANFYFRFFHGSIKAPQLVEFLKALGRQITGKLLIVWDGLPAHRSRLVRQHVEALDEWLAPRVVATAPLRLQVVRGHVRRHGAERRAGGEAAGGGRGGVADVARAVGVGAVGQVGAGLDGRAARLGLRGPQIGRQGVGMPAHQAQPG